MIRVTPTSLIIEIKSEFKTPLNTLQQLKKGLLDALSIYAVADEAPKDLLQNSLQQISLLLNELSFNEFQIDAIEDCIKESKTLSNTFN